jgi:hypothetical protein
MLEDLSVSATNMVLIVFWIIIVSMLVWGAWWVHGAKNAK